MENTIDLETHTIDVGMPVVETQRVENICVFTKQLMRPN